MQYAGLQAARAASLGDRSCSGRRVVRTGHCCRELVRAAGGAASTATAYGGHFGSNSHCERSAHTWYGLIACSCRSGREKDYVLSRNCSGGECRAPALPHLGVAWAPGLLLAALRQPGAGLAPGCWDGRLPREQPRLHLVCGAAGVWVSEGPAAARGASPQLEGPFPAQRG